MGRITPPQLSQARASGAFVAPGDDAAVLGSGAAADALVLTADGAGGAAWEAAAGGGGSSSLPVNGSWYYTARGGFGTAFATSQNRLVAHPLQVPDTTLDRIALIVTTTPQPSTVVRLGVYADDGFGRPGALICEADSTPDTSTTGVKEATLTGCVVTGPQVWLAAVAQGATPGPTVQALAAEVQAGMPALTTGTTYGKGFYRPAISGALPATWGTDFFTADNSIGTPRMWVRVAPF